MDTPSTTNTTPKAPSTKATKKAVSPKAKYLFLGVVLLVIGFGIWHYRKKKASSEAAKPAAQKPSNAGMGGDPNPPEPSTTEPSKAALQVAGDTPAMGVKA